MVHLYFTIVFCIIHVQNITRHIFPLDNSFSCYDIINVIVRALDTNPFQEEKVLGHTIEIFIPDIILQSHN